MAKGTVDWAGLSFMPLHHHDGRFFRAPGLYGLVRDAGENGRLLCSWARPTISQWKRRPRAGRGWMRCGWA